MLFYCVETSVLNMIKYYKGILANTSAGNGNQTIK
jgi:hypothetical protein